MPRGPLDKRKGKDINALLIPPSRRDQVPAAVVRHINFVDPHARRHEKQRDSAHLDACHKVTHQSSATPDVHARTSEGRRRNEKLPQWSPLATLITTGCNRNTSMRQLQQKKDRP